MFYPRQHTFCTTLKRSNILTHTNFGKQTGIPEKPMQLYFVCLKPHYKSSELQRYLHYHINVEKVILDFLITSRFFALSNLPFQMHMSFWSTDYRCECLFFCFYFFNGIFILRHMVVHLSNLCCKDFCWNNIVIITD